jgi:hypothetical protein
MLHNLFTNQNSDIFVLCRIKMINSKSVFDLGLIFFQDDLWNILLYL